MNKCLHINGTCLIGCDAGYQGFLCKTRKYTFSEDGNLQRNMNYNECMFT